MAKSTPVNVKPETLSGLAEQTNTTAEVVNSLYQEEVAALEASATVKSFIGVIAAGRVKRRLKSRRSKH